jgi:prevent-host-death family protein
VEHERNFCSCPNQVVIYSGHVKSISATEFKAHCLRLLDMVQATGDELVVSKRGKPVARIVPAKADKPWLALRGKGRFHGNPEEPAVPVDKIEALKP